MKKRLSLLLALVFCLGLVPFASADNSPFSDVPSDHWAYDAVMETYNDGVMTGTATGVFSPSGKLSMNQFFTVLTRAFYNDDVVNSTWEGAWPNQNLDAAEKHNLFNGIVSWRGDMEVTREIMAQMMYNVMIDKGIVLPNAEELAGTISNIPDNSSVDDAFQTAVATCYYWDLLSGTDPGGSFSPKGLINRAQAAVIYTRLKNAGGDIAVCVHLINGLPGEDKAHMIASAEAVAALHPDMVKLHLLHVLHGTPLYNLYQQGAYTPMEQEEYVHIVCDQIERFAPETVIARVTGDAPAELLAAPLWCRRKTAVTNDIDKELYRRDSFQGHSTIDP